MELIIGAAGAAGLLMLIAFLSPAVERERKPIRSVVGHDLHTRRMARASLAAQVAQRREPRPLRVTGETIRPVELMVPPAPARRPVAAPLLASAAIDNATGPMVMPPPDAPAPRLDWARQTADTSVLDRRVRNADNLVASLLAPSGRA